MSTPIASAARAGTVQDNSLVEQHYETQLQEARLALEMEKWEQSLAEAWEGRELMAAVKEANWLGLRLLAYLRSKPIAVSDLASAIGEDVNSVAAIVARLFRFGAVDLQDSKVFTCTEKGRDLLKNIEANARVSLIPEAEFAMVQG